MAKISPTDSLELLKEADFNRDLLERALVMALESVIQDEIDFDLDTVHLTVDAVKAQITELKKNSQTKKAA